MGGACSLGLKHTQNPISKHSFIYTPNSHSLPVKNNGRNNTNKNNNLDIQDDQQKQQPCQNPVDVLDNRVNQQVVDALYYKIGRYFMQEGVHKSEEQLKGIQKWQQFLDDGQITLSKLKQQKRLEIFTTAYTEEFLNEIEKSLVVNISYSMKISKLDFFLMRGFVPQQDRWSAWKIKVGVLRYFQKGIYQKLKNQDCPCLKNILKDVGRTFVGQRYFQIQEKYQTLELTKQSLREFQKGIEEKNKLENTKQLAQQDQHNESDKYEDDFAGENSPTGKNCHSNDGSRINYRRIDLSENYQSPIQQQQRQIVFQSQRQVNSFQKQLQSPSVTAVSKPNIYPDEINQSSSQSIPSVGQESLHRVLRALSNYFPQLKYTQGMNFIIGFFLLINGGDEEEAFWMFVSLAQNENFLIMGLFENSFPLIDILKFMIEIRLKSSMPELHYHIRDNLEIIYEEWFFQWAITLFLDKFALKEAIRFWDYIISEGTIFSLISLSLSILKELKNEILQAQDHGEFHELFNRLRDDATFKDSNEKQLLSVEVIINGARKLCLDQKLILNLAKEYIISQNPVIQNNQQRVNIYSCYLSSKDQSQAVITLRRGMQLRILQDIENIDKNVKQSPAINADKNKIDVKDTQSDEKRVIQKPLIDSLSLDPIFNLKKHIKSQAFSVNGEEDIKDKNQLHRLQRNRGLLPPIKQGRNRANLIHFPDESNEPAKNKLQAIQLTDKNYPHKDNNEKDDDNLSFKGIENKQQDYNSINSKQSPLPPLNIRWNSLSNRKEKDNKKLLEETIGNNGLVTNIDNEYNQTPLVVDNKTNQNGQAQTFNRSKGAFLAAKQLFHSPHHVKKTIQRANSQSFDTNHGVSTSSGSKRQLHQYFYKQTKESPLDCLVERNKEFNDDLNQIQKGLKLVEDMRYSVNSTRNYSLNIFGKDESQKKQKSLLKIDSTQGTPQQDNESQSNINYTSNDMKSRYFASLQSQTTQLQNQFQSEGITNNKQSDLTSPVEDQTNLSRNGVMILSLSETKLENQQRQEGVQEKQNITEIINKDSLVEQFDRQNEVKNSSNDQDNKTSQKSSNIKKSNEDNIDNHKDVDNNIDKINSECLQENNHQSQNDNSCINLEYHEVDHFQENQCHERHDQREISPTERQQGRQSLISVQREGENISGYINNLHPQNISGFSEHIHNLSAAQIGQIQQTKKDLSILQIYSPDHTTRNRKIQVEENQQQQQYKQQQPQELFDESVNSIQISTARCPPLPQFTPQTERRQQQSQYPPKINSQAGKIITNKRNKQSKCSSLSNIGTILLQNSTSQPKSIALLLPDEDNTNKRSPLLKQDDPSNNKKTSDNIFSEQLDNVQITEQKGDKFNNFVNSGQQQFLEITTRSTSHLQQIEEEIQNASDQQLPSQNPIVVTSPTNRKNTNNSKNSHYFSNIPQFKEESARLDNQKNNNILFQSLDMQDQQINQVNISQMSSKTNQSQNSRCSITHQDQQLKHDINLSQNQPKIDLLDNTNTGDNYQNSQGNLKIIGTITMKNNTLNTSFNSNNIGNPPNQIRSNSVHAKGNDIILPKSRPSSKPQRHKITALEDYKAQLPADKS